MTQLSLSLSPSVCLFLSLSSSLSLSLSLSRRLLPVQTNSPDRDTAAAIHDPVFCSQFTNDTAQLSQVLGGAVQTFSRDLLNGSFMVTLEDGTIFDLCPPATFRAAPPCVRLAVTSFDLLCNNIFIHFCHDIIFFSHSLSLSLPCTVLEVHAWWSYHLHH